MNRTAFKLTASSAIFAMTMVACTAQSVAMLRPSGVAAAASDYRAAARHHEQAVRALRQGEMAEALTHIENAVASSPRDAGYRLTLAEVYLKNGRFESARATFADVLELDPSNVRASLSLALMQIALGRPGAAVGQLDGLEGRATPSDLGLAFALAGQPERAIQILEPAARRFDATPRIRQNLALSYAIAGDWNRARAIAAQDVAPGELTQRLQQWASFARPGAAATQVAALLGVNPVADAGQPVRLALSAPESFAAEQYAQIEAPVSAPVTYTSDQSVGEPAQIPVSNGDSDWGLPVSEDQAVVAATPVPVAPVEEARSYYLPEPEAPAPESQEEVRYAAAAQTLSRPQASMVRTASVSLPAPTFRRAAPLAEVRRGNSDFVVQLGAFSNEGNAERAWQRASSRFDLDDHVPLTTTIAMDGRTLHRVSVAGFASRADATRLCTSIRSQGGACFVRTTAGDASVRWAARYARDRARDA